MKHELFKNKDMEEMIALYEIAKRHAWGKFKISRVRAENSDNVPFELLNNEWLFKINTPTMDGEIEFYDSTLDLKDMQNLTQEALIWGADWGKGCKYPFFVEEDYPREAKWNPDAGSFYIYHWDALVEATKYTFPEEVSDEYEYEDVECYTMIMDTCLRAMRRKEDSEAGIQAIESGSTPW
ncbi:MAG: hypothetical protein ACRCZ2_04140 [Fusobacteriaceae bacterium]